MMMTQEVKNRLVLSSFWLNYQMRISLRQIKSPIIIIKCRHSNNSRSSYRCSMCNRYSSHSLATACRAYSSLAAATSNWCIKLHRLALTPWWYLSSNASQLDLWERPKKLRRRCNPERFVSGEIHRVKRPKAISDTAKEVSVCLFLQQKARQPAQQASGQPYRINQKQNCTNLHQTIFSAARCHHQSSEQWA